MEGLGILVIGKSFFAETDICRTFDAHTSEEEYLQYLDNVIDIYKCHDIYPSFDLKNRSVLFRKPYYDTAGEIA